MDRRHFILDADNQVIECDLMTWAAWFENVDNRLIGYTQVTSEIEVSTVFLGMNHRYLGGGPPLIFETMIFGGSLDQQMWRYSSFDDAKIGHKAAVRMARKAIGQKVRGE